MAKVTIEQEWLYLRRKVDNGTATQYDRDRAAFLGKLIIGPAVHRAVNDAMARRRAEAAKPKPKRR